MNITKDIKMEVMEVHNLFWESYARRDIELRFSLCSEDVTFIGSGLHERALNKAEYKNINREGVKQFPNPFQIEFLWTNLTMLNENVACIESEVVWSQLINNEMSKELLRNTTLLKREYNKWLVTHVHGSVPDYRLKAGDYMTNEQTIIRNRELERQVFERTQDLNKTLEELEQKNRELEIETALEKVRSSALAMKEPADMVNVCNVISDQLQLLGVKDIRNVQTAIINEQKVTYFNYQYFAAYKEGVIEETDFNKHPTVLAMVEEMKKSANSSFSGCMENIELNTFREWRKQNNQFPDPILDEVDSAHYYFYSIGLGGLGLTTYKPLPKEGLDIFKRFHNVFTLAYRRFIDIEKAITQAREAKIEAALEKVRSRTMGMQKSVELKDVIRVVYEQFVHLNILVEHAGFIMDYKARDDMHIWLADQHEVPFQVTIPYFDSPHWNSFIEAKEKGMDFFANYLTFEEKNKFYKELFKLFPVSDEAKEYYFSCPGLAISTVLLENVGLYVENFSGIPYTDEENNTLMRFGKVFQQTYTRFLDLQKAEAQNKIIQAENDRKTKELEEARQLQLSLLPKTLPRLPQFEVAVYMKTATEVGGDYYDFKVQENGVLNIGIGDATGHGLQAGTMITLMKGFFTSDAAKFNPQKFLEHCNGMIREIKLGRILMSFSHLRFENNRLLISSAGMPPIYYHHKKNHRTEEIIIQGLPLGAMRNASYKLVEKEINSGDTILLLTDGLPEQMNSHKVIFDYSRVLKYFDEIAENTPNEIINRLVQKADEWMDGQKQNDDITFVVVRVL